MNRLGCPPFVRVHNTDRSKRTRNAGVVDHQGDWTELFHGAGDHSRDILAVGDIAGSRECPAAGCCNRAYCRIELRL
jgi:hypothetical protein